MEVLPEDYIAEYQGFCFTCMGTSSAIDEDWTLGVSFLRGFYSVYDYGNNKFGFGPHAESNKVAPY